MKITHIGNDNKEEYSEIERIRIAGIDAPEASTDAGKKAMVSLKLKLSGKEVRCKIHTRDVYGRLIAEVTLL